MAKFGLILSEGYGGDIGASNKELRFELGCNLKNFKFGSQVERFCITQLKNAETIANFCRTRKKNIAK